MEYAYSVVLGLLITVSLAGAAIAYIGSMHRIQMISIRSLRTQISSAVMVAVLMAATTHQDSKSS